jgi:methylated-DNA-protein-cysteine methyltransferase-like protein
MTYGQVSDYLGRRLSAVAIGWALAACPEDVPWQRVVNASGGCSTENSGKLPPGFQKKLLRSEGVRFGADGRLSLERYRWSPRR